MQQGLGIAALVIAIISIFIPFAGSWLTVLSALLAAFAYGPGIALGIASIVINIIHIIFFSPLLWATQVAAEVGRELAQSQGQNFEPAFLPWFLITAQVGAIILLFLLHRKQGEAVIVKS